MATRISHPAAVVLALLALTTLAPNGRAQSPDRAGPPLPPPRDVPGITVADAFPRGCVDCHIRYPDQGLDVRFSTLLARWTVEVEPVLVERARAASPPGAALQGRHPEVSEEGLANIPRSCISCHTRRADSAPDMSRLMHLVHLQGGAENPFLTVFGGECTHCHKLDVRLGVWSVPTGPEREDGGVPEVR